MATKKDTVQQIEELDNMKLLVQTYEEIAATRIRRIRNSVVLTRSFIEELTLIFRELKTTYQKDFAALEKKKNSRRKNVTLIQHNGRNVCIFLSANSGLFGDIVQQTFRLFEKEIARTKTDIAIVGKLGASLFKAKYPTTPFIYFDYPDNGANSDQLGTLTKFTVPYENVFVFYGQFQSIVKQLPVIANVYGLENESSGKQVGEHKYFFEPSLETILQFFETEIFASILEQTIHESQLSKNASRMLMLDSASQNIDDTLKKEAFRMRILKHREANTKQLSSLSGMSLWGK